MIFRRLFDQFFIYNRSFAAATVIGTLVLSGCTPQDNSVTETLQSASDWLNKVEPPPPAPEWRLSKEPGLDERPFPKLSDVPPRPDNLPTEESTTATIETLRGDNALAGADGTGRPDATALGGPPPARIAPLTIPGVGVVGQRRPHEPDFRPVPLPQSFAVEADLAFATTGPGWFDAKARAAVANYAKEQSAATSRVLLVMEGPEFSVDPVRAIYNHLLANGLPQERINVRYRAQPQQRVVIQTLGG